MPGSIRIALGLSLLLNVLFGVALRQVLLDSTRTPPSPSVGRLTRDIVIGLADDPQPQIVLPKGLLVVNAAGQMPGYPEPFRFAVVVTSRHPDLVDYSAQELRLGPLVKYSADGIEQVLGRICHDASHMAPVFQELPHRVC